MAAIDAVALDGSAAKGFAFAAGVILHVFVFRIGEWDMETTRLIVSVFALNAAGTIGLVRHAPETYQSILSAARVTSQITFFIGLGLTLSILTYRAFFHRLNGFPGPYAARLSNLYATYLSAKNLQLYEEVQNLHRQYGDFVRLGPSELSIADPRAVAIVHGPASPCTKGPWYNVLHPMISLQLCRNKAEHARRRKVWDRGFSTKALRDYEPRVATYTEQLMEAIEKGQNKPMDVTDWFNFYSFDVMGDMAFGKSFGMLKDGVKHYFMKALHADMQNIGLFSHMLWLFPIFKSTPVLNSEHKKFWKWIGAQMGERRKMTPDRPDVFSWILEDFEAKKAPSKQDQLDLIGDTSLIVVAGSDTTAASITCLFYELASRPEVQKALQDEIDEYCSTDQSFDSVSLSKLPYLEAVVNETLRLHPPVPSGVQRVTPPEGLQIGETYIPGNSIIQIPMHTLMRDERNFGAPDNFIPERWTSRSELLKDQSAFIPFSIGRYACIGKQLGLMEIRSVTAQIVAKYAVAFAPGQTRDAFLRGKHDTFTLALGPLNLVFTPRKAGA